MTRLIDADELLKYKTDHEMISTHIIWNVPTVEAEPVRHGKWLPENRTMGAYWVCSCCGFPSEAHGAFKLYKYCPNCGARMDEE